MPRCPSNRSRLYVSTAEAAYLAGVDTSVINRLIDDQLMPCDLLEHADGSRRVSRLGAALARVYCDLESTLAPRARRELVDELSRRIHALSADTQKDIFKLQAVRKFNWIVVFQQVTVDVTSQVDDAAARAREIDLADTLVTTDPDVMGGVPCFAGTRLPIDHVLSSLDEGEALARLRRAYPFLTDAHIDAARVYQLVRPRRGRPRKLSGHGVAPKPRVSRVVRPASS